VERERDKGGERGRRREKEKKEYKGEEK